MSPDRLFQNGSFGSSYPDMDKMIQMCKILNCNLEDLMDDGVIGEAPLDQKINKKSVNLYMKDFLNFITRSYNMFCSMKFKEKIKFLFEMTCIFAVLLIIGIVLYSLLNHSILSMIGYAPLGHLIANTISNIFAIVSVIVGLIIMLHLYKIRYLDYFVIIEDQNVTKQTINGIKYDIQQKLKKLNEKHDTPFSFSK